MTQQVLYVAANGQILEWQDTSLFNYAAPSTGLAVLDVTAAQWATQASPQYVANGALVAGVAPSALTLAQAQLKQNAVLSAACAAAIGAGYKSSALGAVYTYPMDQTSQINMLGSVAASLLPNLPAGWTTPFLCADASGVWALRPHTAAQIQQAGQDGKAWVITNQTILSGLQAQVAAAVDVAAVQAIDWPG